MGLLEAIDENDLAAWADPDDSNRDGISGRLQLVTDPTTGKPLVGRFGYKATQPRLSHQIAAAFNNDMGVTSTLFPQLDGAEKNEAAEISDEEIELLTRYLATLGVNARRRLGDENVTRGEALFQKLDCSSCHQPQKTTSQFHPMAELREQKVFLYTDLLMHDLGPGLADNLGKDLASGAKWRTAPLWSIGLTNRVSGAENYLHDGRARSLTEAIFLAWWRSRKI